MKVLYNLPSYPFDVVDRACLSDDRACLACQTCQLKREDIGSIAARVAPILYLVERVARYRSRNKKNQITNKIC
jgi:hypothetical protein